MEYKYYKTIDSTNNEAKRLIAAGEINENTCLVADEQTAGRGRQGKSFFSPDTGLYMTAVFPVDIPIASQVTMTVRSACAVAEAIEELLNKTGVRFKQETLERGIADAAKRVGIKWVNDIYISGRKCCGILCEAVNDYDTGRMKYIIAGIGVNIYTREWPEDLKDKAGSLFDEINQRDGSLIDFNRRTVPVIEELTAKISEKLPVWLFDKTNGEFLGFYKSHSTVLGKKIQYTINCGNEEITKEATAVDIDETGGLVLDSGEVLSSGEISIKM